MSLFMYLLTLFLLIISQNNILLMIYNNIIITLIKVLEIKNQWQIGIIVFWTILFMLIYPLSRVTPLEGNRVFRGGLEREFWVLRILCIFIWGSLTLEGEIIHIIL